MRQCRCQSANCKIVWTMGRQKAPGAPAHQATHEIVAADFTIEPFPLPGEYAPGFSYNAEPSQLTPGWGDTRPRGPDAAKVAEIAAAISQRNTERRASWRKENLALSSEDEQRDLLDGNGRVKVASPDTYQNYLTRGFGPRDQAIFGVVEGHVADLAAADSSRGAVLKVTVIDVFGCHREGCPYSQRNDTRTNSAPPVSPPPENPRPVHPLPSSRNHAPYPARAATAPR